LKLTAFIRPPLELVGVPKVWEICGAVGAYV
jgi:hypothetical protein